MALAAWQVPPTLLSRGGLFVAAIGLAIAAVSIWSRSRVSVPVVVGVGVLLRLIVLPMPPTLSDDLWRYLWDGLVQAYGFNPYLYVPNDPLVAGLSPTLLDRMNSGDVHSVYPPLSQLMFLVGGLVSRVAGESAGILAIKVLAGGAELICLLLLARRFGNAGAGKLVLYAWNPLVILETWGQAHGEAFMLPLLIGCVIATEAKRLRLAGMLLGAAVMVKLYPLLLLPLLWRRGGWRSVWPAILIMLFLALPYADMQGLEHFRTSLRLYVTRFEFNAWPYFIWRDLINWLHPSVDNVGGPAAGRLLQGVLLVGTVYIWFIDRRSWRIDGPMLAILSLYIVTATTVHPWYLLGLLALPITLEKPVWPWLGFGLITMGTYVRYTPGGELPYLWISGVAWLTLVALSLPALAKSVVKRRATKKAARVAALLQYDLYAGMPLLDLGCGEGHVGRELQARGFDVTLADVADFRAKDNPLPFVHYDGRRLPFVDDAFEVVTLYYVLHHAESAEAVLAEAMRVGERVVVVESVYKTPFDRRVLTFLDKFANRLRAGRLMAEQEENLHFRQTAEWKALAERLGGRVTLLGEYGRFPHHQAMLDIDAREVN